MCNCEPSLYKYQATAAANVVVTAKPAVLVGIGVGADVATSTIDIGDHATTTATNLIKKIDGSALMTATRGYLPVNIICYNGITVTMTNQTQTTFYYRPIDTGTIR